jgi:translation initiation factor 2 subunit 1
LVKKKSPFPSENDLVICTISKVFSHGAFAKLDEYQGKEGFIHISEVASTWIKNIRDFVREGQKTVAKVLSVDPKKGHIDLSVRRVSDAQRKNKMMEWKRAQKAEKLLEIAAKKIGKTLDEAYEAVGFKLEDRFGEVYTGLEEIIIAGEEALKGLKIPEEWKKIVTAVAKENIVLPSVNITGYLDLRCYKPDGVDRIKKALITAKNENYGNSKIEVKYIKSPRFSINVTSPDYKSAEEALRKCAERAISEIQKLGGMGKFLREQK